MNSTPTDNVTPESTPPSQGRGEAPRLGAKERDALFAWLVPQFNGLADLERAISAGDQEEACKLGRKFGDALRLIDGGLGWSPSAGNPVELTLPRQELGEILSRLHSRIVGHHESLRPDREEVEHESAEVAEARDACAAVLAQLAP